MLLGEGELAGVMSTCVPSKVDGQVGVPIWFSPYTWLAEPVFQVKMRL